MAFRLDEFLFPWQITEDGQASGGLYLRFTELQMTIASHAVQDDSSDVEVWVKLLESQNLSRNAAGDLGRVGDENDRGPK